MAILVQRRHVRLLFISLGVIAIFMFLYRSNPDIGEASYQKAISQISDIYRNYGAQKGTDKVQLEIQKDPTEGPDQVLEHAHQLASADHFKAHFRAVTRLPRVTMAEAKSTCTWKETEKVNFMFGPGGVWGLNTSWVTTDKDDAEIDKARKTWQEYVRNGMKPYANYRSRFNGRGIVVVAGQGRSLRRMKVILRQLKKLGSVLPVEVAYWGDEMHPETQADLESIYPGRMYFLDLSSPDNVYQANHDQLFINYQLKTAALLNSRWAEPLMLDSDNIPTIDPSELYESSVYKEYGTLFWPDIARTRPNNPMWAITDTKCRMNEYELESGQMIVNKHKFFYHLQLAAWFNNEQGEYYKHYILGDKDMFRFAWHALKTKYGFPAKWLTSVGTIAGDDDFYCGHSFAQHHPDGRVAFLHGGLLKTMPREVMTWTRKYRKGIFQAYKRAPTDEDHSVSVDVSIKWDGATYLPNRPEKLEAVGSCTDMWDVKPRHLDEILPGFEQRFEEIGGYWMLEGFEWDPNSNEPPKDANPACGGLFQPPCL